MARGTSPISHLFFTDDCFLYFHANVFEIKVIKQILQDYGAALGQRMHFQKSSISFSRNVNLEVREVICSELRVLDTVDHGHYLGLPSMIGHSKNKSFEFLKDRVWSSLNNLNHRILSQAGKEVLLKTVAQSLPNYAMNVMLLPTGCVRILEKC